MRIIYTPEGGSKREWEFDMDNPPWDVTYGTEKATSWPWVDFTDKLGRGSVIALQALIFTLRKRDEVRLILDSVTPTWGEVDVFDDTPDEDPQTEEAPESGEA